MYSKSINNTYVIISLYVDDLLVLNTNMNVMHSSTKCFLAFKFDMKGIGEASVILCIKIIKRDNDIILTQKHY